MPRVGNSNEMWLRMMDLHRLKSYQNLMYVILVYVTKTSTAFTFSETCKNSQK